MKLLIFLFCFIPTLVEAHEVIVHGGIASGFPKYSLNGTKVVAENSTGTVFGLQYLSPELFEISGYKMKLSAEGFSNLSFLGGLGTRFENIELVGHLGMGILNYSIRDSIETNTNENTVYQTPQYGLVLGVQANYYFGRFIIGGQINTNSHFTLNLGFSF